MKTKILVANVMTITVFVGLSACTETTPTSSHLSKSNTDNLTNRVAATNPKQSQSYILRDAQGNRIVNIVKPLIVHEAVIPSHVRGARIYDDFMIELGATPPATNPLADFGTGTPAGNPWLCSSCHGFDYEGGILTYNGGSTDNLVELRDVRGRTEDFVISMLQNGFEIWTGTATENVHNYTGILTEQAMVDVADFVVNEIFDTHQFVRAPTSGGLGDKAEGDTIYNSVLGPAPVVPPLIRVDGSAFNCIMCHDGTITTDGAALKVLAFEDPFKFLHRTNFGSPRDIATKTDFGYGDNTVMPGLYEVVFTSGLHFGGPEQSSAAMHYIQDTF